MRPRARRVSEAKAPHPSRVWKPADLAAVWLQRADAAPDIRYRPLTRPVLMQCTRLPGAMHGDPADRMLIAMAQLDGVPLVTADRLIIEYARTHGNTPVVDIRA